MEFNKFHSKKEEGKKRKKKKKKGKMKTKAKKLGGGVGGLGTFPIAFEMLLNKAL